MRRIKAEVCGLALVAVAVMIVGAKVRADIIDFSGGNLVLMRGGDASHSQSTFGNGEVPAFLDEYAVTVGVGGATASFVGSFPIDPATMTLPGITTNSHEGRLERSGNGQYLTFGGYQAPLSSTTPRRIDGLGTGAYYQVDRVSAGGQFLSSSLDTTISHPQFVRAAYSNDGSQAWVASKNPNGGLEYLSGIGGPTTTTELQSTTDWRDPKNQDGQLFGGTGSSSVGVHGFYEIGSGEPST